MLSIRNSNFTVKSSSHNGVYRLYNDPRSILASTRKGCSRDPGLEYSTSATVLYKSIARPRGSNDIHDVLLQSLFQSFILRVVLVLHALHLDQIQLDDILILTFRVEKACSPHELVDARYNVWIIEPNWQDHYLLIDVPRFTYLETRGILFRNLSSWLLINATPLVFHPQG